MLTAAVVTTINTVADAVAFAVSVYAAAVAAAAAVVVQSQFHE